MGYYLTTMEFHGLIKKENVSKLSASFLDTFEIASDEDGNIVDIWKDDLKLNFEDEITENAHLFEKGSYFQMVGEDGSPFRWIIDSGSEWDYSEIEGVVVFPNTTFKKDIVYAISEAKDPMNFEFVSRKKRYKLTVKEVS